MMAFQKDRGYAWVVTFGCFMICFIMTGLARAAGVLYMAIIDVYGVTREAASTPFSLRYSIRNMAGPVVGICAQKYGLREVCVFGGMLAFIGSVMTAFAPTITWITISWGVVHGIGYSFCNVLHILILSDYFDKYKGIALGISLSGDCVGTFVFPSILEFLLDEYGVNGTFLVLSGVAFNVIPAAMLLKSPSKKVTTTYHSGHYNQAFTDVTENGTCAKSEINGCAKNSQVNSSFYCETNGLGSGRHFENHSNVLDPDVIYFNAATQSNCCSDLKSSHNGVSVSLGSQVLSDINDLSAYEPIKRHPNTSMDFIESYYGISPEEAAQQAVNIPGAILCHDKFNNEPIFTKHLPGETCSKAFNELSMSPDRKPSKVAEITKEPSSFRQCLTTNTKPMFVLIAATLAVYYILFIAQITIIIDYAVDVGVMAELGKYILISYSVSDLIGRLGFGVVLDKKWLKLDHYVLITTGLMGMCTVLIPFYKNFWYITTCMTMFGLVQAGNTIMYPILVANYLDKKEEAVALGFLNFYGGILCMSVAPMIGFFRDTVGSYNGVFWTTGGFACAIALVWLLEPCLVKLQKKHYGVQEVK